MPLKTGISIQLVAIENINVTPATLLDFSATAQKTLKTYVFRVAKQNVAIATSRIDTLVLTEAKKETITCR